MKFLLVFCIFLLSSNIFSSELQDNFRSQFCSGQIMLLVSSSYQDKTATAKKPIFSSSADKDYLKYFKELSELSGKAQNKQKKSAKIYDKVKKINNKFAANEFAACIDWFKALNEEAMKLCAGLTSQDPKVQEKADKCNDDAAKNPQVIEKHSKWVELKSKLLNKTK